MLKKLLSCALAIVMSLSIGIPVFAAENDNSKNVAKYAISFVKSIYGGTTLETNDVIEIVNEDDALSGYCIDIVDNDAPNGYVIVKFSDNQPIVSEFCIEPGAENPYTEIIKKSKIRASSELIFYSIGSNEYHVYNAENNTVFGFDENISSNEFANYKNEVRTYKSDVRQQLDSPTNDEEVRNIVTYSSLDGWSVVSDSYSGTLSDSDIIAGASNISYYGSQTVSNIGKTYGCSVVALSNMMKYYKYKGKSNVDSDFATLYSSLWTHAGTDSSGSTTNTDIPPAAAAYMQDKGYSISYSTYWWDNYSDFVRDTKADKPMIFSYGADFGGKPGGHTVFCVGYTTTSDYEYLRIADGWTTTLKYINFNGYDYSRADGWSFTKP